MSSFRRRINRMARSLRTMLPEVPYVFSDDWQSLITAPKTIGSDDLIEPLFLAQFFLGTYVDYRDLVDRWSRYFGQMDSPLKRTSEGLLDHCRRNFMNDIAGSHVFMNSMHSDWSTRLEEYQSDFRADEARPSQRDSNGLDPNIYADHIGSMVHEIIENDRRMRIASLFDAESRNGPNSLIDVAQDLDRMTAEAFAYTSEDMQNEIWHCLGRYRHSMLRLSWLSQNNNESQIDRPPTQFEVAFTERRISMSWSDSVVKGLLKGNANDQVDEESLHRILARLVVVIREVGYEDFLADVSSPDFNGGSDSPLGSSEVNLIPGLHNVACHPVLVAVSQGAGRTKASGFLKTMQRVKTHLIECGGTTSVVIFLCDNWDSKAFLDEHFEELKAHYKKGIRFAFLLAGAPGRTLGPVPVDFTL